VGAVPASQLGTARLRHAEAASRLLNEPMKRTLYTNTPEVLRRVRVTIVGAGVIGASNGVCAGQRCSPCGGATGCKTVGSAYVSSNPTPATTCENGPGLRKRGPAARFLLVTPCIRMRHHGSMYGSVHVHMVYSVRVKLAVRITARFAVGRPSRRGEEVGSARLRVRSAPWWSRGIASGAARPGTARPRPHRHVTGRDIPSRFIRAGRSRAGAVRRRHHDQPPDVVPAGRRFPRGDRRPARDGWRAGSGRAAGDRRRRPSALCSRPGVKPARDRWPDRVRTRKAAGHVRHRAGAGRPGGPPGLTFRGPASCRAGRR
jgi:hypothetical protein